MNTTAQAKEKSILECINQARYISTMYRFMAQSLRIQIYNIDRKKHTHNVNLQIERISKKDALQRRIEICNKRSDNVWGAVTAFQGKYINWKNIHVVDGVEYCGILQLIDASFEHPSFKKYSN